MGKFSAVIFCIFCLVACGEESKDFAYNDSAPFDSTMVGEVESFIKDVASEWGLVVTESPKKILMLHSDYKNVFNMAVHLEGSRQMVVWVGNYPVCDISQRGVLGSRINRIDL